MSMYRPGNLFHALWKCWSYFCGGLVLLLLCIVCVVTLEQSRKTRVFVETELVPIAKYVENFRDGLHRLPTEDEFMSWALSSKGSKAVVYFKEQPSFMSDWGVLGRDFVVGAWRGEWIQYYRSWDGKSFAADKH